MQNLKISLIQSSVLWEQPQKNRAQFETKVLSLSGKTDLIILPEMFSTGFTMQVRQFAETMQGATVSWLKEMSAFTNADMVGSLIIREDEKYFNRLIWSKPDGQIFHYDKRHLFRMAGEEKHFYAGGKRVIVELNNWKILPLICYDLRFPVWARNRKNEYDLLIYIANWPERRVSHWSTLLQARAIENQCYVAGVNRTGEDENGIRHTGQSAVFDYLGKNLCALGGGVTSRTVSLSSASLHKFRKKFPVWKDADDFQIKI